MTILGLCLLVLVTPPQISRHYTAYYHTPEYFHNTLYVYEFE